MIAKIREILLTQYIGAMLIALLVWQAIVALARAIILEFSIYLRQRAEGPAYGTGDVHLPWDPTVSAAVEISLYLILAYFLARWLYPRDPSEGESETVPPEGPPPA